MSAIEQSPRRVVAVLCLAEALSMAGFSAYPAFLPELRTMWAMSGAAAGFVGGAFFFGYMLAVPFLSGMTDRVDARSVFIVSCLLAASGSAGFAIFAGGPASASLFQAVAGAGLAGTYMPGLKALTDRTEGAKQSRYIAFYTATFGIGTSLSLLGAGWLGRHLSWSSAVAVLSVGPVAAAAIVYLGLAVRPTAAAAGVSKWPRFDLAMKQRPTSLFILGYAVHCWELLGLRSWMVAFIAFAYAASGAVEPWFSPATAAALINLLGLPASILGNEIAGRVGRRRWIAGVMAVSGVLCWIAGFAAASPWWLMLGLLALHFIGSMADSAALTAGLVAVTAPAQRGAVMAVYSLLGFAAGFAAPLVFGAILDAAGGGLLAWGLAFGSLGLGGLLWAGHAWLDPSGRE